MDIFRAAIATYLEDAQLSDFTIVCGDTEYNVHRVIISAHSKYFARCCSGGFEEAMTRRVELQEDDPAAIARMIEYFYKFDYEDHDDDATQDTIEINAQVLVVADKYDVEGLMMLADEKYSTARCMNCAALAEAAETIDHQIQHPDPAEPAKTIDEEIDHKAKAVLLGCWNRMEEWGARLLG